MWKLLGESQLDWYSVTEQRCSFVAVVVVAVQTIAYLGEESRE